MRGWMCVNRNHGAIGIYFALNGSIRVNTVVCTLNQMHIATLSVIPVCCTLWHVFFPLRVCQLLDHLKKQF